MLVAIIGVDCSGKTTQISRLVYKYQQMLLPVVSVRMDQKTTVNNLKKYARRYFPNENEFFHIFGGDHFSVSYNCDFLNHYITNILPLLDQEKPPLVLSDRFIQCYKALAFAFNAKSDISHDFLDRIVHKPDLQICLDLDIEVVEQRMSKRNVKPSFKESTKILTLLFKYYHDLARVDKNTVLVDANRPIDQLTEILFELIESKRRKDNKEYVGAMGHKKTEQ